MTVILDTSAVLASLWSEPGAARVDAVIGTARISTVNLSELIAKLQDRGASLAQALAVADSLPVERIAFDEDQAKRAGALRPASKHRGLSLGDRCCLALGQAQCLPVMTADRAWTDLDLEIEVEVIR